jgi:hypothetical protein
MYAEGHWRIHMGDGKSRLHVGLCKCDPHLEIKYVTAYHQDYSKSLYSSLKYSFLPDAREGIMYS